MFILNIIFLIDSLKIGGAERWVYNYATGLAGLGVQVKVHTLYDRNEFGETACSVTSGYGTLLNLFFNAPENSIFILNNTRSVLSGLLIKKFVWFKRIHVIPVFHSSLVNKHLNLSFRAFFRNFIYRLLLPVSSMVFVVSHGLVDEILDICGKLKRKPEIVDHYLYTAGFSNICDRLGKAKENIENNFLQLCYVGRNDPVKGLGRLFRLFSELSLIIPCRLYFLCPDIDYEELYQEYILPNDIDAETVEHIKTNSPYYYIKKSNLTVNTSYYESVGNVIVESLMLDTPAITFRNGSALIAEPVEGLFIVNSENEWLEVVASIAFETITVQSDLYRTRFGFRALNGFLSRVRRVL